MSPNLKKKINFLDQAIFSDLILKVELAFVTNKNGDALIPTIKSSTMESCSFALEDLFRVFNLLYNKNNILFQIFEGVRILDKVFNTPRQRH